MTIRPASPLLPFFAALAALTVAVSASAQQDAAPRRLSVQFFGAPTGNGPHHDPITRYRVLKQALGVHGIDFTWCDDPARAFAPEVLRQFDAVLMYGNWNQHEPMDPAQLRALLAWVEQGGGFVPVHCASACFGGSPAFVRLVGARFLRHGGDEFRVEDVAPQHPILQGLDGFRAWDETYEHADHGADREILQRRDGEPWTWTRTPGEGRVFYTASGHDHRVWDLHAFQLLLRNAILWAVGPDKCALLERLQLPTLESEAVSLPGYRERREITSAQKPLSPGESQKLAQVPPGMTLQLFASEPDIVDPIHIAWDHRGRAFVTETVDYPNNLQQGDLGHDRITICEDTDGDGRADRFTRFAEGLSIPTSIAFCRGGVLCTNGGELLFLADTDGDDRADVREVVLTGFRTGDTHAGVSNLRYGFDGWIWATVGYSGFRGEVGGVAHDFAQAVFRFRPDGSALEVLQETSNNTWGLGFTSAGDVTGSTANANPSFYLTFPRADYRAAGLAQGEVARADDNPRFFPLSTDIRQVDSFDRYTSAAGHAVYTATRFPAEYRERVAFVCEPTGKLVGAFELERRGGGFRATQSPNNLFASADAWTAPVFADVGPDGAVWICDWYNLIVQHNPTPSVASAGVAFETGKGNAYVTPLRDREHGRIWRVFPTGTADDAPPALDSAQPASLLAGLEHPNLLWRMQAQRLLVESGDRRTAPALAERVAAGGPGAPHALRVLAQLSALEPAVLDAALRAPTPALRRAAIALADPDALKAAFVRDGDVAAAGRELAEVLVGLSRAAADPVIGDAVLGAALRLGAALFDEPALADAWTMAARRQRAGVLAAAAARGVAIAPPPQPVNLLPNPSFEETEGAGGDSGPAFWTDMRWYSGARGDDVEVAQTDEGRDGTRCLRIRSAGRSDCGAAVSVELERGARYRLSGWVRTADLAPARGGPGAMLNIHGDRALTDGVRGTTDWTEVQAEFDAGPGGPALVHCLFGGYGGASGTAWWDDVALVKLAGGATLGEVLADLAATDAITDAAAAVPAQRAFAVDPAVHARGAEVYQRTCIACHGQRGRGAPPAFPPLDGSDWTRDDPALPIRIVLHGLQGPLRVGGTEFHNVMAPLGAVLSDAEIADVLTYVRQQWSNDAAPVTAGEVEAVRAATADRVVPWTAAELGR
ncbi:MAG: PVC-type heme-binding CxxCH protein [Planctomycetota bacterium]